ncbi:MAG: hypothetical protein Q9M94_00775 [Candidatus Gracilibacteria bacterium]|nr:hypothetical protein [Candidatus Gracilibacteria bacterium]
MNKFNKLIVIIIVFILGLGIVFAANNYFKSGKNWDANVDSAGPANDIFTLTGTLDLEPSTSTAYITNDYRGKIIGAINSDLFGPFIINNLDLYYKKDFGSSLNQLGRISILHSLQNLKYLNKS